MTQATLKPNDTRALDTLRRLASTLVTTIAIEEVAQRVVDAVPEAFGPESGVVGGAISTVDRERRVIRARAITNGPLAEPRGPGKPREEAP